LAPLYLVVAGSRTFDDYELLEAKLDFYTKNHPEVVVISGCAKGADTLGERWAEKRGHKIERFPADWTRHGKRAGFVRNAEMANHADAVVVFWDGKSRGTRHMIKLARQKNLPLRIVTFQKG
jgi:hypothetical protein